MLWGKCTELKEGLKSMFLDPILKKPEKEEQLKWRKIIELQTEIKWSRKQNVIEKNQWNL